MSRRADPTRMRRVLAAATLAAVALIGGPARPATVQASEETGPIAFFKADELEYAVTDGTEAIRWEAQGWYGWDYDKLWLKTRGEDVVNGGMSRAELQLLYSRTVAAFWDLYVGARYDVKPNPSRGYAVVGVQGLAPYWFEVDAAAFVSDEGEASARLEAEYELLFTQRLILEPSAEMNVALHAVPELGVGSGLSDLELGLRLRYEITREFAPYFGISWERKIGPTADLARKSGEDPGELTWVSGVRFWF